MSKLVAGVLSLALVLLTSPGGVLAFSSNFAPMLRHSFSLATSCPGAPTLRKQHTRTRKNSASVFCQSGGITSGTDAGKVLFSEKSSVSDTLVEVREITVTDPQGGQSAIRALWFESSPGVWQSAMKMISGGGDELVPDASQLLFHSARGLALAPTLIDRGEEELCVAKSAAVIGLGGGALPSWLRSELPSLEHLLVSELDATVCKAAESHFGFDSSRPDVTVKIGDGIECLRELNKNGETFDVLVLDAGESTGEASSARAPPSVFWGEESAALLASAVSAGGVLAVNCLVDSEAALLSLLKPLHQHFPDIAYLDNTDISHAWLRTPQTRVALCFKPLPSSSAPSRASRSVLLKAALRFHDLVPSAEEMEMDQRVAKEWSDFEKLQWRVSQQKLWAKTHQGLPETAMLPREDGETGPQSPEQLEVYRKNHPGVAKLQSDDAVDTGGEGGGGARTGWGKVESVEWTEERRQQLRTFAAQHAGVEKLQDVSAIVEPEPPQSDPN